MHPRPVHLYGLDHCLPAGLKPLVQRAPATLQPAKECYKEALSPRGRHPFSANLTHFRLPAVQGMLFIIYGVAGLGVQTLLLRLMLSCLSESRVLVLGEPSLHCQPASLLRRRAGCICATLHDAADWQAAAASRVHVRYLTCRN